MAFIRKSGLLLAASLSLAAAGLMLSNSAASAADVICTESVTGGCSGAIPGTPGGNGPGIIVASDGETSFDPFGAGFDTSDGIQFMPNVPVSALPGNLWTRLHDVTGAPLNTWVLPADLSTLGCGVENNTTCEPVGRWDVTGIEIGPGQWEILEADNSISDVITLSQLPSGAMILTFASDPLGVPEPAIWAMMLIGFFGVGFMMRRSSNGRMLTAA